MDVTCPSCSRPVPADDVNIQRLVATCRPCNVVFSFAHQVPEASAPAPGPVARPPVPLPRGMTCEDRGASLVITRPWWTFATIFLMVFTVLWDGFLLVWFGIALAQGLWFMALFATIHALVGLGLTWFCIASFFNTTTVEADGNRLRVSHGPVPWPGGREFATAGLTQLFTVQHVHRSRNGTSISYELAAVLADGRRETILKGVDSQEQALYLEQTLERFLGIEDRPVDGEVPRR